GGHVPDSGDPGGTGGTVVGTPCGVGAVTGVHTRNTGPGDARATPAALAVGRRHAGSRRRHTDTAEGAAVVERRRRRIAAGAATPTDELPQHGERPGTDEGERRVGGDGVHGVDA